MQYFIPNRHNLEVLYLRLHMYFLIKYYVKEHYVPLNGENMIEFSAL